MSYMDRVRPGAAGAPPDIAPPPPPAAGGHHLPPPVQGAPAHSSSPSRHTSIPTARSIPSSMSTSNVRTRPNNSNSNLPQSSMYQGTTSVNFNAKREAERTAVQDSHLQHLRNNIESRLKVTDQTQTNCSHNGNQIEF